VLLELSEYWSDSDDIFTIGRWGVALSDEACFVLSVPDDGGGLGVCCILEGLGERCITCMFSEESGSSSLGRYARDSTDSVDARDAAEALGVNAWSSFGEPSLDEVEGGTARMVDSRGSADASS
jgi:hypothetical protein